MQKYITVRMRNSAAFSCGEMHAAKYQRLTDRQPMNVVAESYHTNCILKGYVSAEHYGVVPIFPYF